jgi:hypothetical protein
MMRILFFFLSLCCTIWVNAQSHWAFEIYDKVKEKRITDRFSKHELIEEIVTEMKAVNGVEVEKVGHSLEKRDIYCLKWGHGPKKVLLWSQMHGDEPTATMALMDFFQFLKAKDLAPDYKEKIQSELTLYIVPMLNPDGAERFKRRTAAGVDLNRDALRLQHPEAIVLKHLVDSLQPDFGFNLHDQSVYYSAGESNLPATFSFLAPAFNVSKDINGDRTQAMQLIGSMNDLLQEWIPGQVGRYDDTFEPRAFGDNITKWGTATILIECGGLSGDSEKQEIRKMHFGLLLHAFECIAEGCYSAFGMMDYSSIPPNQGGMHDLLLENVTWSAFDRNLLVDIAFRRQEYIASNAESAGYVGRITDLGDLSTARAYETYDMENYEIVAPEEWAKKSTASNSIWQQEEYREALENGFALFPSKKNKVPQKKQESPIRWIKKGERYDWQPSYYGNPTFYLKHTSSGELHYLVNNGQIYDMRKW